MRICLAASGGGHLVQLERLHEVYSGYPHFFLTTSRIAHGGNSDVRAYYVGFVNRQRWWALIPVFVKVLIALLRERPAVVISTGAAVGCLACAVGRVLGARIVWIDSFANTEKLSLSGRLVRPFADLTLSQWPEVAARYKDVEYVGELI